MNAFRAFPVTPGVCEGSCQALHTRTVSSGSRIALLCSLPLSKRTSSKTFSLLYAIDG